MPNEYDVEIREVTKRFGQAVAVDGVSLSVERGKFLTLLGPSGCGKTTTLRMIGGFEYPDAGDIYLRGEPMGRRPPYQRDTSMVFQNYALFPHMSVADNIGYGLKERKVAKAQAMQRVADMLRLVALGDYGDRKPRQLSGGQQQRVALARSLVIEPTVLLLDEPLGALDLKLRRHMQLELKRIQTEVGISFIYVTHDQEEALTMSDTIAVMSEGKVEQLGTPEEIFERPTTRFVADFMGAENIIDAEVVQADALSAQCRIAGATLTVQRPGMRTGGHVPVMFRPEHVQITPRTSDIQPEAAGWTATVISRTYKGMTTAYRLELPGGQIIVADIPTSGEQYDPGQSVAVTVPPEATVILQDRATSSRAT